MDFQRRIVVTAAFLTLFLAHAAPSAAQVNPADMQSGSLRVTTGVTPVVIFTVPVGQWFVLTDIEWSSTASAGDASPVSLNLYGEATERWRMRGAYRYEATGSFQPPVIQSHFATGIAFGPGEVLSFESASQLAGRSYSLNWSGYLSPAALSTAGDVGLSAPRAMQQNVPNPFNPQTKISYTLDTPGSAQLRIFDVSGRVVRTLVSGRQDAGEHSVVWDGNGDDGRAQASGVYCYQLRTEKGLETRKAVMLR